MATWSSWTPPYYAEEYILPQLQNWLLPYLSDYEQALIAQNLYQNFISNPPETFGSEAPFGSYNVPLAAPETTERWLEKISGLREAQLPGAGSAEEAWLGSAVNLVKDLGLKPTRQQQQLYQAQRSDLLANAPEKMSSLGEMFLAPTFSRQNYGSIPGLGRSLRNAVIKGGLVGNPWYV